MTCAPSVPPTSNTHISNCHTRGLRNADIANAKTAAILAAIYQNIRGICPLSPIKSPANRHSAHSTIGRRSHIPDSAGRYAACPASNRRGRSADLIRSACARSNPCVSLCMAASRLFACADE